MSVAPSTTWPLVAIRPSPRMKNPVPMPRTGASLGPPPPCPYMRSRNSRKGSLPLPRAVVATIPTTAGMDDFPGADELLGGGVRGPGRTLAVEQDAELVLDVRIFRRGAADFDVAEELRDDLAGAERVAFVPRGEGVEDRLAAGRFPGHGGGNRPA